VALWVSACREAKGGGLVGACLVDLLLSHITRSEQGLEPLERLLAQAQLLACARDLVFRRLYSGALRGHLASGEVDLRFQRRDLGACLA
jgi:hypothetical protein